jgi:hypothetical protein
MMDYNPGYEIAIHIVHKALIPFSSSGAELPLIAKRFGLLNDLHPFPSMLDADDPIFNLHLTNILFDVILPSVLGFSL